MSGTSVRIMTSDWLGYILNSVLGVFLTTAGNLGSAPAILAYVGCTSDLQYHYLQSHPELEQRRVPE